MNKKWPGQGENKTKQVIHCFPKNALEEIRISLNDYRGKIVCDIRCYRESPEFSDLIPLKKGISFEVNKLPELIRGLQMAERTARQSGYIIDKGTVSE